MFREWMISVYLCLFKMVFSLCQLFKQQEKTVCVASFGDNIFYTTRALREISNQEIIVLRTKSCHYPFDSTITNIIPFQLSKPLSYIKSIYHLATASTILVDNYFGFLAVTNFKPGTTCIQLWHASGALKKFGLEDPSIQDRSPKAIRRFRAVYNNFHFIVVGSDKMATIFERSFALPNKNMLRLGVPRTDFFFNIEEMEQARKKMANVLPLPPGKKVILYAPTFREDRLMNYHIQLDIDRMYKELREEYILLVKFHPAVTYELNNPYEDFMIDVTKDFHINHLLLLTDILITDYSSIPCEFSLLGKPIIFYSYDLEKYQGLPENYSVQIPGPITRTTDEVIDIIKEENFSLDNIMRFSNNWNTYSQGNSSHNLASFILECKQANHKHKNIV